MIIEAAINGSRRKSEHPGVPETPSEIAHAALESERAGAGAVHFHVRSNDGRESLDPDAVELCLTTAKASVPNLPVGVSTGAWIVTDPSARLELIQSWHVNPDFASVNFHEEGATVIAEFLVNRGVGLEAGLSNTQGAEVFVKSGLALRALRVLIEPQEQDLERALETVTNINKVLAKTRLKLPIILHGTGNTTWELLERAIYSRYDVRIGLEDTLRLPNGDIASSNGALVQLARLDAEGRGRAN